jgi:hypothetical protein
MGQVIGQEAQTLGVNQLFAPVVDLARELRYGRVSVNQKHPIAIINMLMIEFKGRGNLLRRPVPCWRNRL